MNFHLNLPELHSLIWDELRRGASPTRSPFTIWQLATLGLDGTPQLRSIVLREADATAGSLCFHTDLRSPKLAEIRADGRVSMLAVDLERHLQLRATGVPGACGVLYRINVCGRAPVHMARTRAASCTT
jgi:pyridoxamine 5'-phosphate oxidase